MKKSLFSKFAVVILAGFVAQGAQAGLKAVTCVSKDGKATFSAQNIGLKNSTLVGTFDDLNLSDGTDPAWDDIEIINEQLNGVPYQAIGSLVYDASKDFMAGAFLFIEQKNLNLNITPALFVLRVADGKVLQAPVNCKLVR